MHSTRIEPKSSVGFHQTQNRWSAKSMFPLAQARKNPTGILALRDIRCCQSMSREPWPSPPGPQHIFGLCKLFPCCSLYLPCTPAWAHMYLPRKQNQACNSQRSHTLCMCPGHKLRPSLHNHHRPCIWDNWKGSPTSLQTSQLQFQKLFFATRATPFYKTQNLAIPEPQRQINLNQKGSTFCAFFCLKAQLYLQCKPPHRLMAAGLEKTLPWLPDSTLRAVHKLKCPDKACAAKLPWGQQQ